MTTLTAQSPFEPTRLRLSLKRKLEPLFAQYITLFSDQAAGKIAFAQDLSSIIPTLMAGKIAVEDDPYAAALLRGVSARTAMLEDPHGSCLSADAAGAMLGKSKTRILEMYKEGGLLGVRLDKQNAVRFPSWQFKDGRVREGVADVVRTFREVPELDDWAVLSFFLTPRDSLGSKPPVELLLKGNAKKLINLAKAHVG